MTEVEQTLYDPDTRGDSDSLRVAYYSLSLELATSLSLQLLDLGLSITTAESCTGGMLSAALTEIPGSSAWFQRGAVTYSNAAKSGVLGVPSTLFETYGAVSKECVSAMAQGALVQDGANVAVSISGIAGPDGAMPGKPVGTVWIGWALQIHQNDAGSAPQNVEYLAGAGVDCQITAQQFQFNGERRNVREQAVLQALRGTIRQLSRISSDER